MFFEKIFMENTQKELACVRSIFSYETLDKKKRSSGMFKILLLSNSVVIKEISYKYIYILRTWIDGLNSLQNGMSTTA